MDDDFFGGFEVSEESSEKEPEPEPEEAAATGGDAGDAPAAAGPSKGLPAVNDDFGAVYGDNAVQLACVYAALILDDDGLEITEDKLGSLLQAANVEVNPFWLSLYSRVLKNRNLKDLIMEGIGGGGGGGAGGSSGQAAGADAGDEAPAKEPTPEPSEESEDLDLDLFG